jgi:hypothetical protein
VRETSSKAEAALSTTISRWVSRLATLVVLAFLFATAFFLISPGGSDAAARGAVSLNKLPAATTAAAFPDAPLDPHPLEATDGEVVHPLRTLPVYSQPGRGAFAKITPTQMGDVWPPVVARSGGWSQVLLPSRPNGSVGWLRTSDVTRRTTPYLIRVHVGSRELALYDEGSLVGTWPIAVGAPGTPTPTGRTFLLGSIVDENQPYSPVILPLGTHSDTLDSYGGGPGTVALHGWPDDSVFGNAVSHGCVRVPADALDQLTEVPLGTLVLIDDN